MAELQIINDTFNRANTTVGAAGSTTGAGNNWIDVAGAQYNIVSNKLNAANVNNVYRNWLLRPASEDCTDQRMVVKFTFPASGVSPLILLRANRTNYDTYALSYASGNRRCIIYKYNGSAQTATTLLQGTDSGTSLTTGTQYVMDAKVIGTTLTMSCYLAANWPAGAAIQTITVNDSSLTSGSFGLSHGFSTTHDQVITYNENAPSSTGYTFIGPNGGVVNSPSAAFTLALTPAGSIPPTDPTTITLSDAGAGGSFNPSSVQLGSTSQQITFTYTPTTSGIKTISVSNNGGFSDPTSLSYTASAAALVTGAISVVSLNSTALSLASTAASGGTGTLTYQWYRSKTANFTPGTGTLIAGATSLTLVDIGLDTDSVYFYKLRVTDSLSVTATTQQFVISTRSDETPLKLGFIGDSISAYMPTEIDTSGGTVNPPIALKNMLSIISGSRNVTVVNVAVPGYTSARWLPATSDYINAKAAFTSAGVTHVFIMLGANDSKDSLAVTPATYLSNMTAIVNNLTSSGFKVILNASTYTLPGSFSNDFSETSTARIQQYAAQLPTLVNGTTVFLGDTKSYQYFATHQDELVDGVHPKIQGVHSLARLWLQASSSILLPLGPLYVNQGGVAKSITPYKG